AYDDMMKRAGEGKTGSISTGEFNEAVMDEESEITADDIETRRLSNAGISPKTVRINEERRRRRREEFNSVGYIRQQIDKEEKKHKNTVANSLERKYSGKFIKKNETYAFYYENDRKKFEKEAIQKGVQLKTRSANTEEKNQMFIAHANKIYQGYVKYQLPPQKDADIRGTQAFLWANQNIKIGDGSNKVSNETVAKAASSTIGQAVAGGYYKLVPTEDKKYENDNPHVQEQVKAAKAEAKRRTAESKDKDYYVRVDGKNKTVTVEEADRPKGFETYFVRDVIQNPLESGYYFYKAGKSLLHRDGSGALKNVVTGVGNLLSPLTFGIGSWGGANFTKHSSDIVQYGTKQEVENRKNTESAIVKTVIDTFVTIKFPKTIGNGKLTLPQLEPVTATAINHSGTATKIRGIALTTKTVSIPAITITGGAKAGAALSNAAKVASNINNDTNNNNSSDNKNPQNNSKQNHDSGITNSTNSTAFTSNRNISASKISNNGVKLDVPKDLTSQVTDIAKKGDLQGFKTEEVVNEILKRDPNVELLDSGKYGSNNGFDHVFRNKKT
ncbi:hypothetical protein, partial [Leptotrichia trevisanii]|uniref:hypothetical protein n=1 Tax=Leptotrichia trevisanii TaxID=109328 RepID=UPI0026EC304B